MTGQIWIKMANALSEDDAETEIIAYGLAKIASLLMDLIITVVLGLILDIILEGILFNVMYISLRMNAGGYHAPRKSICLIESFFVTVGSLLAIKWLPFHWVYIPIVLGALMIISLLAPVEAKNKPLSAEEKMICKKRTICVSIIIVLVCGLLYFAFQFERSVVTTFVTTVVVMVMMLIGIFEEMGRRNGT